MKIKYLLLGTSLSLIPSLTSAQCVATQDCATLGYTETSCSGGSGVKCPFGNKWACFKSESALCTDLGFTLSCTGTGYSSGAGKTCNGKYNYCICSDEYTWNVTNQTCDKTPVPCTIGTLYYSDGTCYDEYVDSKTLLGVVIYEKTGTENGWIMTINPIQTAIAWGGYGVNIPGLSNCNTESCLTDIQASCTNTNIITAQGDSSKYPAAWAAKNYKPTGTPSGKSWCLPSGGLLYKALDHSSNGAKVNAGITLVGGTILGKVSDNGSYYHESIWSSSEEAGGGYAWHLTATTRSTSSFDMGASDKGFNKSGFSVRPVMPF